MLLSYCFDVSDGGVRVQKRRMMFPKTEFRPFDIYKDSPKVSHLARWTKMSDYRLYLPSSYHCKKVGLFVISHKTGKWPFSRLSPTPGINPLGIHNALSICLLPGRHLARNEHLC
jgi:hypothetical protein